MEGHRVNFEEPTHPRHRVHFEEATTPQDNNTTTRLRDDSASATSTHNHPRAYEPPPPYRSTAASLIPALAEKGLTKVAMLPWFCPSPGFEYLFIRLGMEQHGNLLVRGSDHHMPAPLRPYRAIQSAINEYRVTRNPKPDIHPFHDLGPTEIERLAKYQYDWTRDWDFVYSVRNRNLPGPGNSWMADGCAYFKGLSPADYNVIPWHDPVQTMRVEADILPVFYETRLGINWFKFTWKFCERSNSPRWGGSFTVYHPQGTAMPTFKNPWFFFSTDATEM